MFKCFLHDFISARVSLFELRGVKLPVLVFISSIDVSSKREINRWHSIKELAENDSTIVGSKSRPWLYRVPAVFNFFGVANNIKPAFSLSLSSGWATNSLVHIWLRKFLFVIIDETKGIFCTFEIKAAHEFLFNEENSLSLVGMQRSCWKSLLVRTNNFKRNFSISTKFTNAASEGHIRFIFNNYDRLTEDFFPQITQEFFS